MPTANGCGCRLSCPGFKLWLRAWQVQVGRVKLYLLDTNDPANLPAHRGITSELYGGGPEMRLRQEMVLGIGGWRLLRALGIQPEVCHLNEGHAAFAVLERARVLHGRHRAAVRGGAGGHARGQSLHHAHAGGGRLRPLRAGADGEVPEALRRRTAAAFRFTSCWRWAGGIRTTARAVQHGLSGDARQRRGQRRQPPARRGQPADLSAAVPALAASRRCRSGTSPTACTCRLGIPPRPTQLWTTACGKERWLGRTGQRLEANLARGPDDQPVGNCAPRPRADRWSSTSRSGWPGSWRARARRRTRLAPAGADLRSRHADPGLCAALRHLQAAEPAAARSASGWSASSPTASGRCSSSSPAKRIPQDRGRAGDDPAVDRLHPPRRRARRTRSF